MIYKKYECEKHGEVSDLTFVLKSEKHEVDAVWCLLCVMEKLEELGVQRLKAKED